MSARTLAKPIALQPPPQRRPVPQGAFDLSPSNALDRMAALAGATRHAMATLVVDQSRSHCYESILEYLSLCEPLPSRETSKWHPLSVSSHDWVDAHSDAEQDASDSTSDDSQVSEPSLSRPSSPMRMVTNFAFGLGESCFHWPPPPHLSAVALREGDVSVQNVSSTCAQVPPTDVQAGGDEQLHAGEGGGPEQGDGRTVIYVAHYCVGDVTGDGVYKEILLASPDGPETLRNFANEVVDWRSEKNYVEPDEEQFSLQRFRSNGDGGYWEDEGLKMARPVDSVILADQLMEDIITDVSDFLDPSCKKWYASHGLPRRRSYMFHGPPGTGKTSTIRAIASKFSLNCCFLSMTDCNFSNQQLCDALSQIPNNALLVLEDVDTLFSENSNREGSSLTFSGLLNALDGVISVDGVITVMTTNHFERLNQSLVRGGRVDRRFYFGHPSRGQIADLFLRFYPDAGDLAKQFSDAVFERPEGNEVRSIATLQQLFTRYRGNSAQVCLDGLADFCGAFFVKHEQTEEE